MASECYRFANYKCICRLKMENLYDAAASNFSSVCEAFPFVWEGRRKKGSKEKGTEKSGSQERKKNTVAVAY